MHNLLTKQEIQLLSLIEYLYDSKEKVPCKYFGENMNFPITISTIY